MIVWIGWGVAALFGLIAGFAWNRRLLLVREIERGLDALASGQSIRVCRTRVSGPLGRLARRFNEVGPATQARLDQLTRDNDQLRVVLGGMTEGVIAIDARRRLLFANPSADRLLNFDPRSIGRLVAELVRSPELERAVEASLRGTEGYRGEIHLPSRESWARNATRTLSVHGSLLPGGSTVGAVLVFHDVTELRRLERMRQDFVANASHELKTPLASIKAYTETLLDWALNDPKVNARFLHQIDEQADRLHALILDMLSLARLESGSESFHHTPLAIREVIERCAEVHRDRAVTNELNFQVDCQAISSVESVVADEEAVRQIIDNLLDNAIKYTPRGGEIRVRCHLADRSVVIEVSDTGIGIPRDDLPRVFERFYRVDKARSRELGGTGLGLSIVKHLAQSIRGHVDVTSRVGAGSKFRVVLPRHVPPT